jgi:hypothetical protein
MKRHHLLWILLLAGGCGCQPAGPSESELRGRLHAVSVSDGVSKEEAVIIAECYFARNIGCGALRGLQDGGTHWIIEASFGVSGRAVQGFRIEKQSGRVTSTIGPSYEDPLQIYP